MKSRSVGARWRSRSSRGDAAGEQQLVDQIVGLEAGVDARPPLPPRQRQGWPRIERETPQT